jgi:predicted aspartyl protease
MRARVPFRLIGGDDALIVIAARFNDSEPIDCALDTGASHAMLLPEIGARLGVKVETVQAAQGAGGMMRVEIGRADSVAVGEARARDVPLIMTPDFERIGAAIGHRLGGNIGHSFLRHFRLTVDYERSELVLATPDERADGAPARAELPFTLAHASKPLVMIPVSVEGRPFRFAVDTGASTTVISSETARLCQIESTAMPSMTGGGGAVAAAAGVLPSLAVGGVRISRVRVAVADFLAELSRLTGATLDGIVGTNVLRRFRVTIDYPRSILRFDTPADPDRAGGAA